MIDKTLFILMIMALLASIVVYDQYVTQKMGVSPIAKVLDFAGFIKDAPKVPVDGLSNLSRFATFEETALHRLDRLRQIHQDIQAQRTHLVERQKEILDQLSGLNGGIMDEAKKLEQSLTLHEQDFFELLTQLDQDYKVEKELNKNLELRYNEADLYYESQFRDLIQQLTRITQDDLKNLIFLDQELEKEQQDFLVTLEDDEKFFTLQDYRQKQLAGMTEAYDSLKTLNSQVAGLLEEYQNSVHELKQSTGHQLRENKLFLIDLASLIEIDLKRLVSDQSYAAQKYANYRAQRKQQEQKWQQEKLKRSVANIKDSPSEVSNNSQVRQLDSNQPYQKPDLRRQAIRQGNIDQQMQNARDTAHQQGF